jgi:uncharacterized protein (TIGR01741 family)
MNTKKIEALYQKIAEEVNSMIPDKWNKVYLYAEVLWDSSCIFFDFESETKKKYVYSLNIPEEYNVDENTFNKLDNELLALFEELHSEFEKNTPQAWTSLTMYLESSGKFKMDYNYDEITLAPHEQRIIWKYKIFGIYPEDEDYRKLVDDYIKKNGNK